MSTIGQRAGTVARVHRFHDALEQQPWEGAPFDESKAHAPRFTRFLELPRELRDLVYGFALADLPPLLPGHFTSLARTLVGQSPSPETQNATASKYAPAKTRWVARLAPCTSLFLVSRQVCAEVLPIFRRRARVVLRLTQRHIAQGVLSSLRGEWPSKYGSRASKEQRRQLVASFKKLVSGHERFELKLSGFSESGLWTSAMRQFLDAVLDPRSPFNGSSQGGRAEKRVSINIPTTSMRMGQTLGLAELAGVLRESRATRSALRVDAQVCTMDILDNVVRSRTVQAMECLQEVSTLGIAVTVTQV